MAVYRQIISACRALEHPLRVAYLGPPATFTHQAATQEFGDSSNFLSQASIPDVFTEVQRGGADLGVVPVENSTDGGVSDTLYFSAGPDDESHGLFGSLAPAGKN